MQEIPRTARGKRTRFFDADGVDELLSMVLELTAEVSAMRERQYVTEQVLAAQGVSVTHAIEQYQMTDNDEQVLGAERARLLQSVLGSAAPDQPAGSKSAAASTSQTSRAAA